MGDSEDKNRSCVPGSVIPEEVAGEHEGVFERVERVATPRAPGDVAQVDKPVTDRHGPRDPMHHLYRRGLDRHLPLVQQPHPDHRKQRRDDQHIDEEDPVEGQVIFALTAFIIGNVGFEMGGVFCNAFLPDIAPKEKIGRISGYGWSLGYVGGLISLVLVLFLFEHHSLFNFK